MSKKSEPSKFWSSLNGKDTVNYNCRATHVRGRTTTHEGKIK